VKTLTLEYDMSNRMPSLAALLGLVAVAGYQNREKIGDFIRNLQNPGAAGSLPGGAASSARPEQGTDMAGAGYGSGAIGGGLGDLIEHFRNSGLGKKADSWVGTGQNETVDEAEMGQALGPDLLDTLAKQTGLSREELVKRLSQVLPQAVDHMTPNGSLPPSSREGAA
jgi:uncharacterized protein YidB (DUF937 family)